MSNFTIVGAGLAGLHLARSLMERDIPADHITVVDAATPERASTAPGALLHPFPGRDVAPKNENFRVFRRARRFVEWAGQTLGPELVRQLPMVRPLEDNRLGRSLRQSWRQQRDEFPDWLNVDVGPGAEYTDLYPGLERWEEVLVYEPAYMVDLAELRRRFLQRLADEGVHFIEARLTGLRPGGTHQHPRLTLSDGDDATPAHLQGRTVILAMGFGLHDWFPDLATSGRGGALLTAEPPEDAHLDCILNASGHVGPRHDGQWVAGSTWWSPEQFSRCGDRAAEAALLERCDTVLPELRQTSARRIWRGIRFNFGDHQPLVGPIPQLPGIHILSAFGSKGIFRIPFFAESLADFLLRDAPLPKLAQSERISAPKWRLADVREA